MPQLSVWIIVVLLTAGDGTDIEAVTGPRMAFSVEATCKTHLSNYSKQVRVECKKLPVVEAQK